MSHLDPKRPASASELRQFALLVGGAFLVIAGITFWRHRGPAVVGTFATLGAALALTGLVAPRVLGGVYRAWMSLAVLLSRITTPIFMGAIYFVILTPVGVLMRVFGRNTLVAGQGASVWVSRDVGARRSTLSRQF